jgi:hypothetical protein
MSSTITTAQSSSALTPSRNLPREVSLNLNNKNLNHLRSGNARAPATSPLVNPSQRPVMVVRSHQKIRVTILCARCPIITSVWVYSHKQWFL